MLKNRSYDLGLLSIGKVYLGHSSDSFLRLGLSRTELGFFEHHGMGEKTLFPEIFQISSKKRVFSYKKKTALGRQSVPRSQPAFPEKPFSR